MAANYSDQEQVDNIKDWLKNHGPGIIAGVVLGLGAIGGWQWWQARTQAHAEAASVYYSHLLEAVGIGDRPRARGQAAVLMESFDDTSYGVLAALLIARLDVETGANAAAIERLQWALDNTRERDLQDIIRLRLARVLIADEQLDQAEARLDQVAGQEFNAERTELQGDIYRARNELAQARSAYESALADGGNQRLRWKLDSLPVSR